MSGFYSLAGPLIRLLDPECAHGLAIRGLKSGLVPLGSTFHDPSLGVSLWGMTFANPVGLAAGFDKNAEVLGKLPSFGFAEIGSVTPRPQPGNPKPRLFRLTSDRAVINRMGFNNDGMDVVARRLAAFRQTSAGQSAIVGVNLGKNKTSDDATADYVAGARTLSPYADYVVVNVSSPNTPGLRALQGRGPLEELLRAVQDVLSELADAGAGEAATPRPPLLLKIAPDLTEDDKRDIAAVVLDLGVDGIIATNTTIERPDSLTSVARTETGGLSGKPLFSPSTRVLLDFYRLTEGRVPLIGVGGISTGAEAYAKIRAGASLVQMYSALVYDGPGAVNRINRELVALLRRDGFASVMDAVGADHR